jgi:photosystem II stability/assembly factor-like uncharacterized protein
MKQPFTLEIVRTAGDDIGLMGGLSYNAGTLLAVGGTSAPVLFGSTTGRLFRVQSAHHDGLRGSWVDEVGTLWVVGTHGYIARSTDDGASWTPFDLGTDACLFRVTIDEDGAVWACGDGGLVVCSRDDGATWITYRAGSHRLFGITCIDGMVWTHGQQVFRLKKRHFKVRSPAFSGPLTRLIKTPRKGHLLVVGDGGLAFRSKDGGRTWKARDVGARRRNIESIAVLEHGVLLVGGQGMARYSEDDGRTWTDLALGLDCTLWGAAAVPGGAFIAGEDGVVARLTYTEGEAAFDDHGRDCFDRPGPLDDRFEDRTPERFFAEYIIGGKHTPSSAAADFEAVWGVPAPANVVALAESTGRCDALYEWRSAIDLWAPPEPEVNLFEQLVLSAQNAYLGTHLVEAFGGLIDLGSLGNGDNYHMEIAPVDGAQARIYTFDHETHKLDTPFADSLESMLFLSALAGGKDRLSEDLYQAASAQLEGRVSPTWHFESVWEGERFAPEHQTSRYLAFRSLWLTYFLRNNGVVDAGDLADYYIESINPTLTPERHEAWLKGCVEFPQTALYVMWRCYLFDHPHLETYLAIGRAHEALLVRDAAALIDRLLGGENTLGSIGDMRAHLARFRALDLDPDRAEARAAEAAQAALEAEQAAAAAQARVEASEDPLALAWATLDEPLVHAALTARLPHETRVGRLIRFVEDQGWSRDNLGLRHEADAAIDTLTALAEPILEPLWLGAMLHEGGLWSQPHAYLLATARHRALDARTGPALVPVLAEQNKYEHRRERAIQVMSAAKYTGALPQIRALLRDCPLDGDFLNSTRHDAIVLAAIDALAALKDRDALEDLQWLVRHGDRHYRKPRPHAMVALAQLDPVGALGALLDGLPRVDAAVLQLAPALADASVELACLGDDEGGEQLADALEAWQPGRKRAQVLSHGRALRIVGRASGDLGGSLSAVFKSPGWSQDDMQAGLIFALETLAALPELATGLLGVTRLRWYAFVESRAVRTAARRALRALGEVCPACRVIHLPDARAMHDGAVVAALADPTVVGKSALAIVAGERGLTAARGPLAQWLDETLTLAFEGASNQPRWISYPIRWAGQALATLGLNDHAVVLYNQMLGGDDRELKGPLLRHLPDDARIQPGVQYVSDEGWGWQGGAANDWLKAQTQSERLGAQ